MRPNTDHSALFCSECGEIRMNTESYSVCPNGHGRLHPRISSEAFRLHKMFQRAKSLKQAVQVKGKPRTFELGGGQIRSGIQGNQDRRSRVSRKCHSPEARRHVARWI